jgi:hypothetical protein
MPRALEPQRKDAAMEKNKKKKAGTGTPKGSKRVSEYKSREADGKSNQTDVAFQKAFGKGKAVPHKG